MKKILLVVFVVFILLFTFSMLFMFNMRQHYDDPAYQSYKDKYFKCVNTGSTLTPDAQIYQKYKNKDPISCN